MSLYICFHELISKSSTRKLALTDKNGLVGLWVKRETVGTKNYYKPLLEKIVLNLILLNTSKWYYDFEIFTSQNHLKQLFDKTIAHIAISYTKSKQ